MCHYPSAVLPTNTSGITVGQISGARKPISLEYDRAAPTRQLQVLSIIMQTSLQTRLRYSGQSAFQRYFIMVRYYNNNDFVFQGCNKKPRDAEHWPQQHHKRRHTSTEGRFDAEQDPATYWTPGYQDFV